jgi:yeast amino acid transporter
MLKSQRVMVQLSGESNLRNLTQIHLTWRQRSMTLPILAYGFIGIEIVSICGFEARDRQSLRFPSKWIAYLVFVLYFSCAIGEAVNVSWSNSSLPVPDERKRDISSKPQSTSVLIIAVQQQGISGLPGFLNACIIFAVLSAANTALYVSSRTLFGLTRGISPYSKWPLSWLSKLGTTTPNTLVPAWALVVSAIAFFWLPFLHLKGGLSITDVSSYPTRAPLL